MRSADDPVIRSQCRSAPVHLPKTLVVISEAEQAIARIMPLATIWAGNEAAQMHTSPIEFFRNGEGCTATARDQ